MTGSRPAGTSCARPPSSAPAYVGCDVGARSVPGSWEVAGGSPGGNHCAPEATGRFAAVGPDRPPAPGPASPPPGPPPGPGPPPPQPPPRPNPGGGPIPGNCPKLRSGENTPGGVEGPVGGVKFIGPLG